MRYLVTLSYNGKNYFGWQKQKDQVSIQETIESALSKIYAQEINIYGSGRTDAGVHAHGQTFHYDAIEKYSNEDIVYRLNCILPKDIFIKKVETVNDDFHARFNAKSKTYVYKIKLAYKDPFLTNEVYLHPDALYVNKIKEASNLFIGKHDFKDFTSKEEDEDNFIRTIYSIDVKHDEENINIYFNGNGFMRYQIRFMVGAILSYAEGKEELTFIRNHIDSNKTRDIIRYKVPSDGLYLLKVDY